MADKQSESNTNQSNETTNQSGKSQPLPPLTTPDPAVIVRTEKHGSNTERPTEK